MLDFVESKRINIKDLAIKDVPRRVEQPFGPNPHDWNKVYVRQVENKLPDLFEKVNSETGGVGLIYTSTIKSLTPNQDIGMDTEECWQKYKGGAELFLNRFRGSTFDYEVYFHTRNLFPNLNLQVEPYQLTPYDAKEQFDKETKDYGFTDYMHFAPFLTYLPAFAPSEVDKFNPQEFWKGALDLLKRFKERGDWGKFATLAADFRLAQGSDPKDLLVDELGWNGMASQLKEYGQSAKDERFNFASLALDMKILAAREAYATKDGLKLVMGEENAEFSEATPNLPGIRKF